MTDQHPITPPPELTQEWSCDCPLTGPFSREFYIATQAARWGADQELEACCEYLTRCAAWEPEDVKEFREHRRPKSTSLKQQALDRLRSIECNFPQSQRAFEAACENIRRALESLPD